METRRNQAFIGLLCAAMAPGAIADGNMRCGSRIIEVGMTQSEVLALCGEPTSRVEDVVPVRSGTQVVGETPVHRWTYSSYSTTRVLVFDAEKLLSIE